MSFFKPLLSATVLTVAIFSTFVNLSFAEAKIDNIDKIRAKFGLDKYDDVDLSKLKVAILDNGFAGYDQSSSEQLPASARLVEEYSADFLKKYQGRYDLGNLEFKKGFAATDHGLLMAQIVWAMSGANQDGPEFHLLNANGITNFRRAVAYAIVNKVDIVLYSQNRECCGNFDGEGFINEIVTRAASSGILWVNAAGNYGGKVYNGAVTVGKGGWLKFGKQNSLRFRSLLDENTATVTLSWTSPANDDENVGTDKDLDIYVYDEAGDLVGKSENVQVLTQATPETTTDDGEQSPSDQVQLATTLLSRERIDLNDLVKNDEDSYYTIKIKAKGDFDKTDRLRLTVYGGMESIYDHEKQKSVQPVDFVDATGGGEIMVPADNPLVIAVGDLTTFSAAGPTTDGRSKPDVTLETSKVGLTNGKMSEGTSNAAAYFAGILAVLKAAKPDLNRQQILDFPTKCLAVSGSSNSNNSSSASTGAATVGRERVVVSNGGWGWIDKFDPGLGRPVVVETTRTVPAAGSVGSSNGRLVWRTPTPNELEACQP